jgi:FixJ family two-component response regulator
MQKLHAHHTCTTLVIGLSHDECSAIRKGAEAMGWKNKEVQSYREAMLQLCREKSGVIVCNSRLPDGTWEDILSATATQTVRPRLIVVSRHADERLWAEVLNLGGFDVLASPCDDREILRALEMAWRNWWDEAAQENWWRGVSRAAAA